VILAPIFHVKMVVVVQPYRLMRVQVGQHIDVFVHQDFMGKIVT
jgi:hypothetical protein